ncbi:hypothetical protein HAX54_024473 [Datura stramonium]|uniref:DYW domain-containing protein n=1 Tax=Datura stramonium TaxID=4076 RepID=A0ABS8UYA3_DATST|nr:hypothetical protein [Datura stramonium]
MIREGIKPTSITFSGVLNACSHGGLVDVGFDIFERERVAKILLEYGAADSTTYILLSNVYASLGKVQEAAQVSKVERRKVSKRNQELDDMLKSEDYAPATDVISQDIEEHEKKWALSIHSERLAICYGLISTKPCTTIRVRSGMSFTILIMVFVLVVTTAYFRINPCRQSVIVEAVIAKVDEQNVPSLGEAGNWNNDLIQQFFPTKHIVNNISICYPENGGDKTC